MVKQLSKFSPNLAEKCQPLRELLVKCNTWAWGVSQQRTFLEIKKVLTASPVLALFDPNLPTVVSADAIVLWPGSRTIADPARRRT